MKRTFFSLVSLLLLSSSLVAADRDAVIQQEVRQIGEEIRLSSELRSPAVFVARNASEEADLVWSTEVHYPDAEYVAPFFSKFDIPKGAYLIVRSPDGTRSWKYTAEDRARLETSPNGFWGIHIYGSTAIVELYSRSTVKANAVVIGKYSRGFRNWEMPIEQPTPGRIQTQSLCGSDDSKWAKCYQTSEAAAYGKAKAVARLMINGSSACTGWLVGSDGHVMTNNHCIGSASDATNTTFEFMAEGSSCTTDCASWGACPGTVAASSSSLVKTSSVYDYALVKLPTNISSTYGYLQMRKTGAVLNERIYIPQHPAAWGKKIAMTAGSANAKIDSLSEPVCMGGTADVGYSADTQGGSSGSPVVAYGDNLVVALHHCGTCPNRAVPIQDVITDLGSSVPTNGVAGSTPPPTCTSVTGSLSGTGANAYTPSSSGFASGAGSFTGKLTGPSGQDFDLYLQKLSGSTWTSVASGLTSTPNENVSYTGTAGTYRWRVYSYRGSGSFTLCTTKP